MCIYNIYRVFPPPPRHLCFFLLRRHALKFAGLGLRNRRAFELFSCGFKQQTYAKVRISMGVQSDFHLFPWDLNDFNRWVVISPTKMLWFHQHQLPLRHLLDVRNLPGAHQVLIGQSIQPIHADGTTASLCILLLWHFNKQSPWFFDSTLSTPLQNATNIYNYVINMSADLGLQSCLHRHLDRPRSQAIHPPEWLQMRCS